MHMARANPPELFLFKDERFFNPRIGPELNLVLMRVVPKQANGVNKIGVMARVEQLSCRLSNEPALLVQPSPHAAKTIANASAFFNYAHNLQLSFFGSDFRNDYRTNKQLHF